MHTLADIARRYPDEFLYDATHVVCTHQVLADMDWYEWSLPTAPSAGRVYKRGNPLDGWLVMIVADDPDDPQYQLHHPHRVLTVEATTD